MASVNKVILIGNLGADPEVRYTEGGNAVANMRLATNERWTDRDGNPQERTEWHSVVVWGKTAENCGKYLQKGRSIYIEGRLQSREYTDKEGAQRRVWEVVASNVTFLGGAAEGGGREGAREGARSGGAESGGRGGSGGSSGRGGWGSSGGGRGGEARGGGQGARWGGPPPGDDDGDIPF